MSQIGTKIDVITTSKYVKEPTAIKLKSTNIVSAAIEVWRGDFKST
jgi:hypothetical protein